MLLLKENEVCPLALNCQYANDCWGAKPGRKNEFNCDYVDDRGYIKENQFRNPYDKTGKMKIIVEG